MTSQAGDSFWCFNKKMWARNGHVEYLTSKKVQLQLRLYKLPQNYTNQEYKSQAALSNDHEV